MKILIVNTYDNGGAAKASLRLANGLRKRGVKVDFLLKRKIDLTLNTHVLELKRTTIFKKYISKVKRKLKKYNFYQSKYDKFLTERSNNLELFSLPNSSFDITASPLYKEADIINLHWVSEFLDFSTFFKNNSKPIVWTMHDMNPFSGGEHYEEIYLGINDNGFPKKRILSTKELSFFEKIKKIKKTALLDVNNLHIVSPSQWLANKAKESELFKNMPIHCIANSIDTSIYKPKNIKESKEYFNIPEEKKIILFVADSITANRKGFVFLERAIKSINNKDVVLCVIGKNNLKTNFSNIIELGVLKEDHLMSLAYSAADVFVIPSLMDNLPNTVLESLMCGTPVIGFPVGGIPEMIQNGVNGLITKEISVGALIETINQFLDNIYKYKREDIFKDAFDKYNLDIQAKAYENLFKSITEKQ
ncbi:glycosyltransferase [uncultured Polaribacter sp.]|uniref:glycosyltransferase n=1 Tax=uncultured Polaribacter sp. TaxID=174711 RepID=UPI002607F3B9|nr:glycosyltransferase [uncultured Polaribacter sp.]